MTNDAELDYCESCLMVWRNLIKDQGMAVYANGLSKDYLKVGLEFNHSQLIIEVLDFANIPTDTLTLKERVAYFYMLNE